MDPVCMEGLVARGFHCTERASSYSIVSGSMGQILGEVAKSVCYVIMSIVNIIASKTSRGGPIMHLLRGLHFICAYYIS